MYIHNVYDCLKKHVCMEYTVSGRTISLSFLDIWVWVKLLGAPKLLSLKKYV